MADGSQMQVGARGVLHDLRAAKQYNGQEVVLKRWMEVKERWKCRLPDNIRLNVRPSNLKPCKGTATSSNPTKVEALLSAATNSPERPPVAALPSPAVQVRLPVAALPPPKKRLRNRNGNNFFSTKTSTTHYQKLIINRNTTKNEIIKITNKT